MGYTLTFERPCEACGKGTNSTCDSCGKPFCGFGACLFETGRQLSFPPDQRDEFPEEWSRSEEVCQACFIESQGHPPYSLWAETARHSTLAYKLLQKGSITPTGDAHSWYSPPHAGNMLRLRFGDQTIELDTFSVVQLMNFLQPHNQAIRDQAKETADLLIPEANKSIEAGRRADAGLIDYSQYE